MSIAPSSADSASIESRMIAWSAALYRYDFTLNPLDIPWSTRPDWYKEQKHHYPPFKQGLYLEEYIFRAMSRCESSRAAVDHAGRRYLPFLWTNYQIENENKTDRGSAVKLYMDAHPSPQYFAVVQHDDGITSLSPFPRNIHVYGACQGDTPIPLIYEDRTRTLLRQPRVSVSNKSLLCSFVGSMTHYVRRRMFDEIMSGDAPPADVYMKMKYWSPSVPSSEADEFLSTMRHSKFVLAPRGYGRQSFRFYEAFQVGSVPVYVHDTPVGTPLWLPYQEEIDYEKICILIHVDDMPSLIPRLRAVTDIEYQRMLSAYAEVEDKFTLDYLYQYILRGPVPRGSKYHKSESVTG
jgi:hypothetical protein